MIETRNKFGLSARRLVRAVATSALPLSAVVGLSMASAPSAYAVVGPPTNNYFFFTPFGGPLDDDKHSGHNPAQAPPINIYDIVIGPNKPLNFDVYLYQTHPGYNGQTFLTANFTFSTDPLEYIIQQAGGGLGVNSTGALLGGCITSSPSSGNCTFSASNVMFNNGAIGNPLKVATVTGMTVNPEFWPGNGEMDFRTDLTSFELVGAPPLVNLASAQFQDVEVQQTPAPLSLLGVGAAFGFSRNLRKRIKGSKSPEVMSALG
jgi:hypothetical protein